MARSNFCLCLPYAIFCFAIFSDHLMFYGQDLAFMGFALPQDSRLVNVRAAQKQKLMGRGWNEVECFQ